MRRKYVEKELTGWYDISSSAISKAIRGLASKDLNLIKIEEHPKSAREKLLTLTPTGAEFMQRMVKNGSLMCDWFLGEMSRWESEVDVSLYIYSKINTLFSRLIDQEKLQEGETLSDIRPQESLLHHPLMDTFVRQSYSWSEIPHIPKEYASLMQLNIFFPIHYKAGNKLETVLRSGVDLSRQQVIILWLIAEEGKNGTVMPRKQIESALKHWLEITSSSISKAIRSLTTEDMKLLEVNEHPLSGREKCVSLTPEGELFVRNMFDKGVHFLQSLVDSLSDDEIDMVMHIFSRTDEIFETYPGPDQITSGTFQAVPA